MRMASLFLNTCFLIPVLLAIVAQSRPIRGVSSSDLRVRVAIIGIYENPDQTGEIMIPTRLTCTSEKPCKQGMLTSNYERRPPQIPPPSPKSSPPSEEITHSSSSSSTTTRSYNGIQRPSVSSPPPPQTNPDIGQLGLASSSSSSYGDDHEHEGSSTTNTPSYYISMITHKDLTTADPI